jgi:hypothetical protein
MPWIEKYGMNANRKLANHLFAHVLRQALVDNQGRTPSAAKFADAFNLRAHGTSTITRETARKWLRGDAMPELGKMGVLIKWLNIDPSSFLQPVLTDGKAQPCIEIDLSTDRPTARQVLVDILQHLDDRSIETLYLTAAAMHTLQKKEKTAVTVRPSNSSLNWNQKV